MNRAATTALLLAAAIAGPAATPALAGQARPPAVRCGQVISHDTRLSRDLVDCPGTALTIGADGVTLDLGGHVVDGINAPGSEGIAVDGHSRVTVANGTVREFRFNGVAFRDSARGRVHDVAVKQIGAGGVEGEDVSAGIFVDGSDGVEIEGNRVSNHVEAYQADGIVVLNSSRAEIARNYTSDNAWNGIVVVESPQSRVLRNRSARNVSSGILVVSSERSVVSRNVASGHVNPDTGGIVLLACVNCVVAGNELNDNDAAGISVENVSTSTKVVRNRVRGGGDGILVLDSDENTVAGNGVQSVAGIGIVLDTVFLDGSDGNTLSDNAVVRSGLVGILVVGGSDGNLLSENVASGSAGTGEGGDPDGGIVVDGATGNRLERNVTARNAADGIHVATAGNRLARNRSFLNRGHGIDAIAGTIDGGGNRAFQNALSPQCSGVVCG
jgi:parallel beta-helix repeat protein